MISKTIQKALNDQVNKELYSAYLYLAISAKSAEAGLPGFAVWFRHQYEEETEHAMKIFDHLLERGGSAELAAVAAPKAALKGATALFTDVLEHERKVTASIHAIADLAIKEGDHATRNMLEWFVSEQVEEEASVQAILDLLQHAGESGPALVMVDRELAKRGGKD